MSRFHIPLALAALLTVGACADQSPVEPAASDLAPSFSMHRGSLLQGLPVIGTLPGGTFAGLLNITNLEFVNGQLLATGTLTGTSTIGGIVTQITQAFTDIPLSLLNNGGVCRILELDLGPLNLDLLGLVVDLSAVSLDVTGQRGPGNLLGNLLCAITGLLDRGGPLSGILNLLDRINLLL